MRHTNKTLLIMAGGTGGHVFPALAVAKVLLEKNYHVEWLGTARGIEAMQIPKEGIPMNIISVSSLRGKKRLRYLTACLQGLRSLWEALCIMYRVKPVCVLGMGGFVSGPGGVAAWLTRCPLVIHEQNAVAGMTNRLLAPLAKKVLTGYPIALGGKEKHYVGNPIRQAMTHLPEPSDRLADRSGPLRLLVLGGSLGAKPINDAMHAALSYLDEHHIENQALLTIWHQTGSAHIDTVQCAYDQLRGGVTIKAQAFIDDMTKAYTWADLVLCRAGALTIAEISAVGVASILVPLPHAVDDHQTANARYLVSNGAALLLPQAQMTDKKIVSLITSLANDREHLLSMAKAARAMAKVDAAKQVAAICLQMAND